MSDGAIVFRSGKIAFVWRSDRASHAELLQPLSDGTIPGPGGPGDPRPLLIAIPPTVRWEDEAFTLWCCEVLGILLADRPTFTAVSDPVPRGDDEDSFSIAFTGPFEQLERGMVVAPVPEASL